MKRARVSRAMATAMSVVGDKEGDEDGGKSNGDGNNSDNDKDSDDNNDRYGRDLEPAVHNIFISAASSTCPCQPQQ
jgi:hypothetical protein